MIEDLEILESGSKRRTYLLAAVNLHQCGVLSGGDSSVPRFRASASGLGTLSTVMRSTSPARTKVL